MVCCLNSRLDLGLSCAKGLSESEFSGDFVYKLKKIAGSNNF